MERMGGSESLIDIVVAFQRAIRSFELFVRPIMRREGLNDLGTANVLMLLGIGETSQKVSALVRDGRYCSSNASYSLTALERNGLILRERDPNDGRSRIVSPTERGIAVIRSIRDAADRSEESIEEAIAIVARFEERLVDAVSEDDVSDADQGSVQSGRPHLDPA